MIGIIFKSDLTIEEMGDNWEPKVINSDEFKNALTKALGFMPIKNKFTYNHEGV